MVTAKQRNQQFTLGTHEHGSQREEGDKKQHLTEEARQESWWGAGDRNKVRHQCGVEMTLWGADDMRTPPDVFS